MPPPRPAERLRALRWVVKDVRERLQRWVRMSRVIAAREKRSEAGGFVWCECQVFRVVVVVVVDEGDEDGGVVSIEEVEVVEDEVEEVIEGAERSFGLRDQIGIGLRICFEWVASLCAEEDADDEEAEEVEKAKEKRDGELGSPMRMTVPFEAAESGRGMSGDSGGLSWRGVSCIWAGFFLRAVRPPDGSSVRLGAAGCTGAAVRTQRSGAEYW